MPSITSNIGLMTNKEILKLIGTRFKNERIAQNLQQEKLANKCELSIRAIQRLEQTGQIATEKLIIVLRVLNRLSEIDKFMDFSNELEELSYDEFKAKNKISNKKRVFNNKTDEVEKW